MGANALAQTGPMDDAGTADLHQQIDELKRLTAHYQHKAAMSANRVASLQIAYDQLETKCRALRAHLKKISELANCCPP